MSEPQSLEIESDGVHVLWDDGHQGYYPHWYLRAACQCADCKKSAGYNRVLFYEGVVQDVQALDWRQIGKYAIEFLWSDGHEMGVYAFETLRQICRCRRCVAAAAEREDS